MADQEKSRQEQRNRRSGRHTPVIDLKAEEVPLQAETAATQETTADVSETAKEMAAAVEPAPDQSIHPQPDLAKEPEPVSAPAHEPLVTPPPSASKPSLTLSLVAAALVGMVFGGIGGSVVPALFGGSSGIDPARLKAVETRQAEFSKQVPAGNPAALVEVQQKITALETELSKRVADATVSTSQNVQRLEGEVRTLANRPAPPAAVPAPAVDLSPLQQRLASLEAQLKSLDQKAENAAKAVDPRLAALDLKVDQTARKLEAGSAAPLFSAVQGLVQAFHRGAPFLNEIMAVEVLGAKAELLTDLRPLAEKGAPTAQRLAEGFSPLAARLAGIDQTGVMGLINRVVTIRPSVETAGDQPAAIVGSIEAALRRGDVSSAVMAWNRLPEAARTASAAWGADAARRDHAAKALTTLQDAATAALRK